MKYIVIYEDLWNNKTMYLSDKIGDTLKELETDFDIKFVDADYDKLNSEHPEQSLTFGVGFYDIYALDDEEDSGGRVMIFFNQLHDILKLYKQQVKLLERYFDIGDDDDYQMFEELKAEVENLEEQL